MILKKAHSGKEEKVFKTIYESYKNRLFGFVLKMVHDKDMAEELIQEIFISLWLNRSKLTSVKDMDSYLFVMARNKTFNYLRKAANDAKLLNKLQAQMQASQNNVEEHIVTEEQNRLIEQALGTLSVQRRKVFMLSRYEGLNMEEISERLQLSRNTIKNHLVSSLRIIRSYLSEHGVLLPLLYFIFFHQKL